MPGSIHLRQKDRMMDNFFRTLDYLNRNKGVPFSELFTPAFISHYTAFNSWEEMLSAYGRESKKPHFGEEGWDDFVGNNSSFNSWYEMKEKALGDWIHNRLYE